MNCNLTPTMITSTPINDIMTITGSDGEIIMKITNDGIFYKHENEMVKVNCPEDITDAFLNTVLNYNNKPLDDVIFDNFIEKIKNSEKSNFYIKKLESTLREIKLNKLNNL